MGKGNRNRRNSDRDGRILAGRIGKLKRFNTTHGSIILNPMKRHFLGKPYKCPEYQSIMENEIKQIIETMNTTQETER